MKLVVFFLFAVCCSCLASTLTNKTDTSFKIRKLGEVLRQMNDLRENIQNNDRMLTTPPVDIEDVCCRSALECLRASLTVQYNVTENKQKNKLLKSLRSQTVVGLCNGGSVQSTCQDCASQPKENATTFFNRLESFVQKAIARLNMIQK